MEFMILQKVFKLSNMYQKGFQKHFQFQADLKGADVAAATFDSTAACLKSCTKINDERSSTGA